MKTKQQRINEKQKKLIDHLKEMLQSTGYQSWQDDYRFVRLESELSALEAEPDSEQPRPTRKQIRKFFENNRYDHETMFYIPAEDSHIEKYINDILSLYPEQPSEKDAILYNGTLYWYEKRLAKNGDVCLATKNPKEYCNGLFSYSSKDPGDGLEYVVINATHPEQPSEEDIYTASGKAYPYSDYEWNKTTELRKAFFDGAKAALNGQIPVSK
jgi:hypothetical protein